MFMFVDGRPVVLSFALVEALYYKAFLGRFPEAQVSLTQWRGSYEYQALYPDMQMIVETGVITRDAMNYIGDTIAQANEAIRRPACLYSRVPERFAEAGYEASIRIATEATKGTVAICVGQTRETVDYQGVLTAVWGGDDYPTEVGWRKDKYGAISNRSMFGVEMRTFTAMESQPETVVIDFLSPRDGAPPFVAVIGGISVTFTQSAPGSGAWWGPSAEAYHLIRLGGDVVVTVADGDTAGVDGSDDIIGALIRDEMLPAGQWMEGDVIYDTALSNEEPITIRWTTPTEWNLPFRLTITRRKGSPHPENTVDEIIEMFLANFAAVQGIGKDVYPATYLTTADLPWAASILAEWTDSGETDWWADDVDAAYNVKYTASVDPARVVIV